MRQLPKGALLLLASTALALLVAAPAGTTVGGSEAYTADCSKATATQLVAQHDLNGFLLQDPVRQVLCGPFMGPGSEAMAVTIGAPTCWPIQQWAIFGVVGGAWQLLETIPAYLIPPLTAVGSDIREETAVPRPGDSRCLPTGGTHARLWHWNGTKFVAGAWTQVKPADRVQQDYFVTPSGNIDCQMGDHGGTAAGIFCQSGKPPRSVGLRLNGRLQICRGARCVGNPGEGDVPPIRTLAYGKQSTVGRFRCRSQRIGVTCVVIRTGKGFLLNRSGVTRVG
jgi:hypothetical protein